MTNAVVTPWTVEGDVDYDKLIKEFGSHPIDTALLERLERVIGKEPHHFLRRGIFFSHRDMNLLLDVYESGQPFYLYTGRGPSSESMHMGHLIPFIFTKWLQDAFKVPLVIQMTDDEKFFFRNIDMEQIEKMTTENIKDIIAMGFDPELTFIFRDFDYMGQMYRTVAEIERAFTASQVRGCFGFKMEDNCGRWMFPAIQAAPSFSVAFPHIFPPSKGNVFCLIPQAIDQDPYFRLTRDIAPRLGFLKPAVIHSKFFPGLSGSKGKMSSSTGAAVLLTDTEKMVKDKINKHAFSGGGATKEEQLLLGANADVDVPIQWMSFFMEDDESLARIRKDYMLGRIMTGEVKKLLIEIVSNIVKQHQEARKKVTDDDVKFFTSIRPMGPAKPNNVG
ncbi:putative tryptophanyl-tRNA synthetase [Trypanosoma cruzi]|uniref:Tryptophan--tRNA ligase, cytoplasmic n=1 Tax=Trypanosoma cruzi TaxID=5693 RepID=A0A2V2WJX8_TRYCR|nr:tryptophanyl-tRNA synthetase [Trypanosoma cruzi]KAF8293179.1 putative tryptophanyl-tRNA synthetase [Trypanosoma cruzi]PWV07969.1 putative tryptophanyl-tRNA synthetase [Trypanosoma cruzi]RNC54591.1 putative tryptophanyl-tRNA synthetase [Trypanosoma cruzi]